MRLIIVSAVLALLAFVALVSSTEASKRRYSQSQSIFAQTRSKGHAKLRNFLDSIKSKVDDSVNKVKGAVEETKDKANAAIDSRIDARIDEKLSSVCRKILSSSYSLAETQSKGQKFNKFLDSIKSHADKAANGVKEAAQKQIDAANAAIDARIDSRIQARLESICRGIVEKSYAVADSALAMY